MQTVKGGAPHPAKKTRLGMKPPIDFFPLLLLPFELIGTIFGFLSTADRMRARVNRQLYQIEAGQRYALHTLAVHNASNTVDDYDLFTVEMRMANKPSWVYKEALAKIAANHSFQKIHFELFARSNYADVFDVVSTMKAPDITISIHDDAVSYQLWTRERTEEFMEGREIVWIEQLPFIDFKFVMDVYEIIDTGLDTLRGFACDRVSHITMRRLLATLGLFVNYDREFVSTNRATKVYKYDSEDGYMISIGAMRIFAGGIVFSLNVDLACFRIHKLKDGCAPDEVNEQEVQYVESVRDDFLDEEAFLGDEEDQEDDDA